MERKIREAIKYRADTQILDELGDVSNNSAQKRYNLRIRKTKPDRHDLSQL
jgi:hypothetical protein